jgi:hypothetical protein
MSQRFDLQERLIIVPARISGPAGDTIVRLAWILAPVVR